MTERPDQAGAERPDQAGVERPGPDLAGAAADADPRTGLRAVRALRRLVEHLEDAQVRRARGLGWSWQEIADVLGVSRQAVHKKYGRR